MSYCFPEPTLGELLEDSLTQGLMRADKVDEKALRNMLRGISGVVQGRKPTRRQNASPPAAFRYESEKNALRAGRSSLVGIPLAQALQVADCRPC